MLYSLAIVLALAMVLCMIPTSFAAWEISGGDYAVNVGLIEDDGNIVWQGEKTETNSYDFEYNYETADEVRTSRTEEDAKMAMVQIRYLTGGFADPSTVKIYIDGKELQVNDYAVYYDEWIKTNEDRVVDNDAFMFPIELTKSGFTDTLTIVVEGENEDDIVISETIKLTLRMENTASYKNSKTAYIKNMETENRFALDAYVVGDKIYIDYVNGYSDQENVLKITFKDNNGDLFDRTTWLYGTSCDVAKSQAVVFLSEANDPDEKGLKLDDSAAIFDVNAASAQDTAGYYSGVVFKMEDNSSIYETKEYDIVIRENIKERDPEGIYFAESTKTIRIGETYTPVILGVETNAKISNAVLSVGSVTVGNDSSAVNAQVIDIDGSDIIGTREGSAYVTATYTTNDGKVYKSSSMKVTVTAQGATDDDDDDKDGKTYIVTASSLRVRSGAGTNFSQIGSLKNGATVKVESIANGWAKLENGGYVSAQYLAEVVDNGEAQTMYVTARTLNVRKGPGTSYAKAGTLSRGTAVQVVGFSGNWAKLSNGYYVSTSYLAK